MNKKLEKLLCLFLCVILLCSIFSGCGNSNQPKENSTAQAYIDMAQEYIDVGNYTSAIDVLKKGYASTGDERINALLQDLLASQTTNPTINATDPPVTEPSVTEPPATKPPATEPPVTEPPATEPPVITPPSSPTFLYTHSGTISISSANISLQDSAILYVTLSYAGSVSYTCDPSDVVTLTWGQFDYSNTAPLYITANKNGTARIKIYETDYPNNYLTVNVTVSNHVSIDTSKASGILASMGLTEQEFRNACTYIGSKYHDRNEYVYAAGREYYAQHPEEAKRIENYTMYWYDYLINGKKSPYYTAERAIAFDESNNLDEFLNYILFGPKGASILGKQSEEILKGMLEYPADYINQPFLLKDFRTTYVSNYNYTDDTFVIYDADTTVVDYRDDVNYPRIQQGYLYDMYVVFKGINDYGYLIFALISVEKCT